MLGKDLFCCSLCVKLRQGRVPLSSLFTKVLICRSKAFNGFILLESSINVCTNILVSTSIFTSPENKSSRSFT